MAFRAADDTTSVASVDAYQHLYSYSDVPVPLPLFSPVPEYRTRSAPISRPVSPPLSPAPTVLVSLHTIGSGQASGGLSLHEYRKNLSHPQLDEPLSPGPRRTLRRKPKALNLNVVRSPKVPPSPPPSPISVPSIYPSSSVESLQSCQSLTEPAPSHAQENFDDNIPYYTLTEVVSLPNINPPRFTIDLHTSSQQPRAQPPSIPSPSPYTPATSVASGNPKIKILNAFRHRLKQIPVKLISHHKSSSDSALFLGPSRSKSRLRHRGVSFEILSPPKPTNLPVSSSSEYISPKYPCPLNETISAPFFDPMSSQFLDQSPSGSKRQGQQTPLKYAGQSWPESDERLRTPPRALFEDLPTAHSSITSRITNQRSNMFPLFPYIDHPTDDLDTELPFNRDIEEVQVTLPPNCPYPLASHSENETPEQALEVLSPQEREVPSAPIQGGADNPRTTFTNLVLSGASIGQLSNYFSSKTSRTDSRLNAAVFRRQVSKLTKPRPPDAKQSSQWKKLRPRITSGIISNFIPRQLHPRTRRSRVEKRNSLKDVGKRGRRKSSMKQASDCRRITSDPLERLSANIEALVARNVVSITAYPQSYPSENSLKPPQARPRSSLYSSNDQPSLELDNQTHTDGDSYLVDPRLSTDLSCNNRRHPFQWSSTSSPNFSKPIRHRESRPTSASKPGLPISYSSGYPNSHPSLDHHSDNNIPEAPFNVVDSISPTQVSGTSPNIGDPGTLQSSSISGIADYDDFPADEYEDMGPGSSQTASSPQLSRFGTFSTLKSRFRLPATLSSRSKESVLRTQISHTQSPSQERKNLDEYMVSYEVLEGITGQDRPRWNEREDSQDWQTVADSQQFKSDMRSDFSRVDTGSSLANYSSYGSLANAELKPWTSLAFPGRHPYFPCSPSNPVVVHPGQQSRSHSHRLHQNPTTGNGILLPDYQYPGKFFHSSSSLAKPMPVLRASTEVCPSPLVASIPKYQHPGPLSKPHVHPFKNPPPALDKWRTRLRNQSLYQPSRIHPGPGPASTSSKSDFFDFSYHQQHQPLPQYQHSHQHNPISRGAHYLQNSVLESLGPPATVSSDWCTVSSSQDMSMSVLNRDRSFHSPSAEHNTNNHVTSIFPPPFKNFHNRHKRPFSHKYPRMSMFTAENLATNKRNSQHSLPLTSSSRSAPRDYSHGGSTQRADVLQMPERVHLTPTYSSTDRLIPDLEPNQSPPPFHNKPSGDDGITASRSKDTGNSQNRSQSAVSETKYQQGQYLSTSRLRWPFTQENDNQTTKRYKKAPSRDDLIRQRIRQLDDPIAPSNVQQSSREAPPRPLSERGTVPSLPHMVASRPVNANEELEAGQWYCSENGRYAFSTPPRLFKTSTKYRQRTAVAAGAPGTNFALQRRVGRELIIGSTITLPLGWFMLGYIALVGERANWLIRWRSGGEVADFHYKEIRLARQLFGAVLLGLVIIGFVAATAILASRDKLMAAPKVS
ncbi:hypothetical protein AJ78_07392 [Emergomyces pasteurianus Ep9510]|uniref:Uncharacterized protein n=1 Tax=Emergomyces pasteurianus Ep9510 TaxID=1447872 RepID=A0A1J9Q6U2_9EURO|nr:hypothetical protein AJ78_07392 [Emergomyces pasteurianus Ep9510]